MRADLRMWISPRFASFSWANSFNLTAAQRTVDHLGGCFAMGTIAAAAW
jgi:hypothetical protein